MDPAKRAAQFIRMNDLVVQNVVVIPVFVRHAVFAVASAIRGFDFSPFSGPLWRLVYWTWGLMGGYRRTGGGGRAAARCSTARRPTSTPGRAPA